MVAYMKKFLSILLVGLLALGSNLSAITPERYITGKAVEKLNELWVKGYNAVFDRMYNIPELKTSKEVLDWVAHNIDYESDEELNKTQDYWQSPEETLTYRRGDCEDFSILAMFLLARIGIPSVMVFSNTATGMNGQAWEDEYPDPDRSYWAGHATIWVMDEVTLKKGEIAGFREPQNGRRNGYSVKSWGIIGILDFDTTMYIAYYTKSLNPDKYMRP